MSEIININIPNKITVYFLSFFELCVFYFYASWNVVKLVALLFIVL